jgi:hypothetical protein
MYTRTTVGRQASDAARGARVQNVRRHQQPLDHRTECRGKYRLRQPALRVHARGAQPVEWQVDTSRARILSDIARNVGELHRHAQIAGTCHDCVRTYLHQQRHQRPDAAGDTSRIGIQFARRLVAPSGRIPLEALQQRCQQCARYVVLLDHAR